MPPIDHEVGRRDGRIREAGQRPLTRSHIQGVVDVLVEQDQFVVRSLFLGGETGWRGSAGADSACTSGWPAIGSDAKATRR